MSLPCKVCNQESLALDKGSLSERLEASRASGTGGCVHQATDLFIALLQAAGLRAETRKDQHAMASIVLSTLYDAESDSSLYEASFFLSSEDAPFSLRRGELSDNPAQATINLLVQIHDELLLERAKGEVSH